MESCKIEDDRKSVPPALKVVDEAESGQDHFPQAEAMASEMRVVQESSPPDHPTACDNVVPSSFCAFRHIQSPGQPPQLCLEPEHLDDMTTLQVMSRFRGREKSTLASHKGRAEDSQKTYRDFTEDLQRVPRGLTEDSQSARRGFKEDSWRTCGGSMENSHRTRGGLTEDSQAEDTPRIHRRHTEDPEHS